MNLSVVIIAKNAETLIEDCLKSVAFADEVIVVDAFSTDSTKKIAQSYGARVIRGSEDDFSEQRNIGLRNAKGDWIFYIDTDERISDLLRENIQFQISHENPHISAFKVKRKNFYLGNHQWPTIETLERLFRKDSLKGWYGKLHESPRVEGKIGLLEGYLLHYSHRDLESMLEKTILWSRTEAKLRFDTNHPKVVWWRLIRVLMTGFWDSYVKQGGFRAGTTGLIESIYQGYSLFITYATLWEMQNESKK